MATVTNWIDHLSAKEVAGAVYPGVGTETVLVLIAIVLWIGWHVVSEKQESDKLKKLARKILPTNFDFHRKQGFAIPLDAWLQEKDCRDYFNSILLGNQNTGILNKDFISKELNGSIKGYLRSERLFSLVLFELWCREYKIRF